MFQSFVGLEIHIQLQTVSKIFCSCRAAFGDEPNTNVCPVCMGYPGTLPALNAEAVRMGYLVARSLNCSLARTAVFDRKNYYYPDLPKNYQISQYGAPVGTGGYMDLEFHRKKKRVRIHDVHVEEDPAKMIHAGDMTLLDFNRSGTPLLEIVTEPDLEIGEEAEAFLQNFRRLVRYLGVCDGNMEEGSLRCDANVSVNLRGKGLGDKVEVKNMNSSRFVRKAIAYEIQRQEEILSRGGTVQLETRLWNENRDITESMRTKETAQDYRYFPDPDLPPFRPGEEFIAAIEDSLIELPYHRRLRLITEYGLNETQADFICDERETADFFEATAAAGAEPLSVAAWLGSDVRKLLNRDAVSLRDCPLTPERLAELLGLLAEGKIHGKIAKQVLEAVFAEDKDPGAIIAERGLEQITDRAELAAVVERVLESHAHVVRSVREGDGRPVGFLVGQIMKATAGRAEPLIVNELLKERLASDRIIVLAMGGAISGSSEDGMIVPGNADALRALVDGETAKGIAFEDVSSGAMLSEEITPEDWASLIAAVAAALEGGNASGIVIPHGTDTLSYTASLIYWLFRGTGVPIVFTISFILGKKINATISLAIALIINIIVRDFRISIDKSFISKAPNPAPRNIPMPSTILK